MSNKVFFYTGWFVFADSKSVDQCLNLWVAECAVKETSTKWFLLQDFYFESWKTAWNVKAVDTNFCQKEKRVVLIQYVRSQIRASLF